jgi:hypothetical protein
MELSVLSPHAVASAVPRSVAWLGATSPPAGRSVVERHQSSEWGARLLEFVVSVEVRDPAGAVRRVSEALKGHGAPGSFAADR